jgi:hypothetical protein
MKFLALAFAVAVSAIPLTKRDTLAHIEIFEHVGFQGYNIIIDLDEDDAHCKNIDTGSMQDTISSAKWFVNEGDGICFHRDKDCNGDKKCFDKNALPIVNFKEQQLNDKISSVSLYAI